MSRAKQIAAAIIADVWPTAMHAYFIGGEFHASMERAVEKHAMRPHQVRDRDGDVWEQTISGKYRCLDSGTTLKWLSDRFGPLTEVQGEPLPDAGEVERLKARIADLRAALRSHCLCRFEDGKLYEECHYHECQRSAAKAEPVTQPGVVGLGT